MKKVLVAVILLLCTVGPVVGAFVYEYYRTRDITVEILTRSPERGNYLPRKVVLPVGRKVRMRIRNVDTVMHGFAVPGLDLDIGELSAGHQATLEFTPEKVGRYDFYCTTWCSEHHLQMRGVIEIVDSDASTGKLP